jgi:Zn ribbon nucleic-acid-binding protein
MGSFIDEIECPNCEHEAFSDFYYKTGEQYVNCQNCGYHYSATIIDRTKKYEDLTEHDWEIVKNTNPYGAYRIKYFDSPAFSCGSIKNKTALNKLKKDVKAMDEVEYFHVSRFVDGEIKVEVIIDKK